ncbi:LacI family DNA-binding transcriptional regulator [Opitutus sp. ER46]|uniref:LacI family DNA-binding transcriptional regulator n=1 Tax=Opitutus sp. ER46 TaxID=2161864 RepID=UPI000D320DB3|nr:LacI family DNA-binding transcriptional regulator [Opitutus sp. ER46]PTX92341.1 hypothetical protein DB354_13455 [Opitutus sp. ER46]
MRTLAERAGVSSATISLALRGHPRISAATRRRILRLAEQLGYRPDPSIAKLMLHLRTRRPPGFQSLLAALTTVPEAEEQPYLRELRRSAQARAEALGYGLTVLRVAADAARRPDLERMLRARGVDGILLLPMAAPREFRPLLDWRKFSVVSATNAVLAPQFHRVVPHQFSNALLLCEELTRRGYRRLGLVMNSRHDLTVGHGPSAAVVWQNMLGGTERVMPLIFDPAGAGDLREWFERERPDAIIAEGADNAQDIARQLGLRVPGPVGFVTTNRSGPSVFAGIEERPDEIGAAAIRLLTSLIQHGEKGIPKVPTVTMVAGAWVEGRSVRAPSRAAPRKAATA